MPKEHAVQGTLAVEDRVCVLGAEPFEAMALREEDGSRFINLERISKTIKCVPCQWEGLPGGGGFAPVMVSTLVGWAESKQDEALSHGELPMVRDAEESAKPDAALVAKVL